MPVTIRPADPHEPEAEALLRQSHALMQEMFPAELNHFLSLDALARPGIRFFAAETESGSVGCGALALREGYGEVKSMFVAPAGRGAGAGARLLEAIEAEARAEGLAILRLETGTGLDAAHRLYRRAGFTDRDPFGDYEANPYSLFMEKTLG